MKLVPDSSQANPESMARLMERLQKVDSESPTDSTISAPAEMKSTDNNINSSNSPAKESSSSKNNSSNNNNSSRNNINNKEKNGTTTTTTTTTTVQEEGMISKAQGTGVIFIPNSCQNVSLRLTR